MEENSVLKRFADSMVDNNDQSELNEHLHFCVEDSFGSNDIAVEVEEIGKLNFPIDQACVEKLISVSAKAKFGLRNQTIFDKNVRDTQVIPADKLHVNIKEDSLERVINKIKTKLGLGDASSLTPHLYNMLIYGKDQFFAKHQDTEKLNNMIATIVIALPSPHIGGNLIIEHGKNTFTFSSENVGAVSSKRVAFYADCMHEIQKVKEGYRVTLTYNLVLEPNEYRRFQNRTANLQLKAAMKDYFAMDNELKKLAYFLNHSYTEHGLKWHLLKGEDRANVCAIRTAAKELGLVTTLALVKIKESWSTMDPYEKPDMDDSDNELNDREITLSYWIDVYNKPLLYDNSTLFDKEICWTKDTKSFEPSKKKYGFTGNEGGTMDLWYRRAAIVLWPESKQIPMAFQMNCEKEINDLTALTSQPGNEKEVREIVEKAGCNLYPCSYKDRNSAINNLVNIAHYINDADKAGEILLQFKCDVINPDTAKMMVKMHNQYGINWMVDLINFWKNVGKFENKIIDKFNDFVNIFLKYGGEPQIILSLLEVQSSAIVGNDSERITRFPKYMTETLSRRIDRLWQIFEACAAIQNVSVLKKVIEHVTSNAVMYEEISLSELFLKVRNSFAPDYLQNFEPLKAYLIKSIEKQLAPGKRSENDWSIAAKLACNCELCVMATNFLQSKTEKSKTWPLAEKKRTHVIRAFNGLDLPVELTVERKGSPHKLILIKNKMLHINSQKKFDKLKSFLKDIQATN